MKKKNLIGISGKKGAGKDTVGKIIQYLCYGADKANISFENWDYMPVWGTTDNKFHTSLWQIKKFAGKLKEICSLLTGFHIDKWEDQEWKNEPMGEEWNRTIYYVKDKWDDSITCSQSLYESDAMIDLEWYNEHRDAILVKKDVVMTPRLFMQLIGTEAIKNNVHPNAFVNALFVDYHVIKMPYHPLDGNMSGVYFHGSCAACKKPFNGHKRQSMCKECAMRYNLIAPNWIIADMRFPNEFAAVKQREGICVRINRITGNSLIDNDTHAVTDWQHPSETALDDAEFDWIIDNAGTIEELIEKVREMLVHFKIINKTK